MLGIGFGIGIFLSAFLASGTGGAPFVEAFAMIARGPVVGTIMEMHHYHPIIIFAIAIGPCLPICVPP